MERFMYRVHNEAVKRGTWHIYTLKRTPVEGDTFEKSDMELRFISQSSAEDILGMAIANRLADEGRIVAIIHHPDDECEFEGFNVDV